MGGDYAYSTIREESPSGSSNRSTRSKGKSVPVVGQAATESTPLLVSGDERHSEDLDDGPASPLSPRSSIDQSPKEDDKRVRWPTVIALTILCAVVIAILVVGFAAPSAIKDYAEQAAVFEPIAVSIAAFTSFGVRTRVQASFYLDSSRVKAPVTRKFGRIGTWVGKEVETEASEVLVYLPEYGNTLLGKATIPSIKVNIRDGYRNIIDIFVDLKPGNVAGIRGVANKWLEGNLDRVALRGVAAVPVRSGLLNLGAQDISETIVLQGQDLPDFPEFNITKLNIHEIVYPGQPRTLKADVSLSILNRYSFDANVPPLGFEILVPNCVPGDDHILVGNASTDTIHIEPKKPSITSITGYFHEFPDELTTICPGKSSSPLDLLVQKYVQGLKTVVYIRGGESPSSSLPVWLEKFLRNTTIPFPITSNGLSNLIKRFSMTNVHFYLPDPLAEPDTPEAQPKVSALVKTVVALPDEINVPLNISRVKTVADVYYHGEKFGYIDLKKWQNASVSRIKDGPTRSPALLVEFDIKKAPLQVTDENILGDILKKIIFGSEGVTLQVKAKVAAELDTSLGQFVIRDIPGEGKINVKPRGSLADIHPQVQSVRVSNTTKSSMLLQANINFTNPSNYSANIPYVNFEIFYNGTDVARVLAKNISVVPGLNSDVKLEAEWNPLDAGGEDGTAAGRKLLSHYISGVNTSVTVRSHKGTIPALPALGRALSIIGFEFQIPKLRAPGDDGKAPGGGDDRPHFIKEATNTLCFFMHLLSSTADFTLLSPLPSTTLIITSINATAFYNHTIPVGKIVYSDSFAVPPGSSQTPRLPVALDFSGAGYEALRKALGGTLKIDAAADIGIKLGDYVDLIYYSGKGIGAKVRL